MKIQISLLALAFALNAANAADAPLDSRWKRLYSDSATASSFLQNNWNKYQENYHPNYALDDDAATAWVKGTEGEGIGETLSWQVSPLKTADRVLLRIRNGYQKSERLFKANSSVKDLEVSLLSRELQPVYSGKFTLTQTMGWQQLEIDVPRSAGFSMVRLKVLSVYPGTVYKDLCISDVQTYVQSQIPYDAKVERAKDERLHAWIRDRLKAAKYFASLPLEYPFESARFDSMGGTHSSHEGMDTADHRTTPTISEQLGTKHYTEKFREAFPGEDIQLISALLEKARALQDGHWYRATPAAETRTLRAPELSGDYAYEVIGDLKTVLPFLLPERLSFFETPQAVARMVRGKNTPDSEESGDTVVRSNVKIEKAPGSSAPRYAYFWVNALMHGREINEVRTHYIIAYDDHGHAVTVMAWHHDEDVDLSGSEEQQLQTLKRPPQGIGVVQPTDLKLYTIAYDDAGKVREIGIRHAISSFGDGNMYFSARFGARGALVAENEGKGKN